MSMRRSAAATAPIPIVAGVIVDGSSAHGVSNTCNVNANTASTSSSNDAFLSQTQSLINAEVHMISGCHSEETSADLHNIKHVTKNGFGPAGGGGGLPDPAGKSGGACTSALLDVLYAHGKMGITYQDLLLQLRQSLKSSGLDQIPQLTSSRPLELQRTPFQLAASAPGGASRALLVGINYRGQYGELNGCHNDVRNVQKYLIGVHGFEENNISVLIDDGCHPYPTRCRIIAALQKLVEQSRAGDSVYFHYSGHGGLLSPDSNIFKSNLKEYDETLYPVDHERSGQIRDFSLFSNFVRPLRAGVRATCVMDACHSGSVLDLPYSFRPTDAGQIRMRRNMTHLSNLAFLYVLAGGVLQPGLFDGVGNYISDVVGSDIGDYQGTGIEDAQGDYDDFGGGGQYDGDVDGYGQADVGDQNYAVVDGQDIAADNIGDAPVVEGEMVSDGAFGQGMGDAVVPGTEVSDYGGGDAAADSVRNFADTSTSGYNDFGGGSEDEGCGVGEGCEDGGGDDDVGCGDCAADVLGALLGGD